MIVRHVGRPRAVLLAVELRRARRRHRRRAGRALAPPLGRARSLLRSVRCSPSSLGVPAGTAPHPRQGRASRTPPAAGRSSSRTESRSRCTIPLIGVGTGGFRRAYAKQAHLKGKEPKAAASHDTPITVAAETGVPGLALLAWLVWIGVQRAVPAAIRSAGATGRARLGLGLALVAIVVHSLFYDALFEDPLFWAALALSAVAARVEVQRRERLGARARARPAHRRRRVRLRRDDGEARRGGRRCALRRLLDRDAVAAGGLSARHARARGARGDGRARHPGRQSHRPRLRRPHLPGPPPGDPRAADRALERLAARRRLPALAARRPPGPPDDRGGGAARVQAHDDPRLRDPLEQLRLRLPGVLRARAARTSSARSPRSRGTPHSSTAATPTPSTSGTSRARTGST